MTPYTLIIIDMQTGFDTAKHSETNHHIERQIKQAMALNCHIVFVEFEGYDSTNKNLISLTIGYTKTFKVFKRCDSGAYQLNSLFTEQNIPNDKLVVCGVNSRYCVSSTVLGLLSGDKKRRIEVPIKACNCHHGYVPNKSSLPKDLKNPFLRLKFKRQIKLV